MGALSLPLKPKLVQSLRDSLKSVSPDTAHNTSTFTVPLGKENKLFTECDERENRFI